ncbi:MAG: cytochrome c1 [Rhizomicrobium sp.]
MRIALGLGFSLAALFGLATTAAADTVSSLPALPPKDVSWSFDGPFGHYDRAALQRGFQVYKEICSACHSLNRVAFHTLSDEGGPGFTPEQVKAIAAGYKIPAAPNDMGDLFDDKGNRLTRPGVIADYFPPPFANEQAARAANNGALPPDLSVIVKAREGGPSYVFSILTGFGQTPPANFKVLSGKFYNPYFNGRNISMPPPLVDGAVTYSDGTKATIEQEAHDVVTFLSWAAEPKMEERKRLGFGVIAFLLLLSALLYLSYRKIWHDKH